MRLFLPALVAGIGLLPMGAAHAGSQLAAPRISISNVRVSNDTYLAHSEPHVAVNPKNARNLVAGSKFFTDPATYQFKIGTYFSRDGGRTWHDSGLLPGFESYTRTSDIAFAFSATGVAYATVLAHDATRSGIFVSRSNDGGKSWSKPATVYLDPTGATFSDKPWIEVDRTSGPQRGTIYVAWNLDGNQDEDDRRDPDAGTFARAQ